MYLFSVFPKHSCKITRLNGYDYLRFLKRHFWKTKSITDRKIVTEPFKEPQSAWKSLESTRMIMKSLKRNLKKTLKNFSFSNITYTKTKAEITEFQNKY